MIKSALSVPDSDQVTVSFALYVDTAVWFSWTDTVSLPDITILTLSLGSSVTVIATFFWALAPDVSVTVTVKLYTLLVPKSDGFSKSGAELNDNSPLFEILNLLLS